LFRGERDQLFASCQCAAEDAFMQWRQERGERKWIRGDIAACAQCAGSGSANFHASGRGPLS
jgi:hypothetical protein